MPASALADPMPCAPSRRLARVEVCTILDEVRAAWDALLAVVPVSAYQTPDWIDAWLTTRDDEPRPLFVVGSDPFGPVALLPLGRTAWGPVTVARFLGGRDANFGLGLFHPDVPWNAHMLRGLLAEAARLGGTDLFWFGNQPGEFGSYANPLALLPGLPSPSLQHETALDPSPDCHFARTLSSRARKHIRQKEAKLAAVAPVRHERAHDPASADRILAAMLAQRGSRFGPTAEDAGLRAFFLAATGTGAVELHALTCGDEIVATFAGAAHAGRFSGMVLSFAAEDSWARYSPGELLVARIIAEKCKAGFTRFDLGIGEARYKTSFCSTKVPLVDTVLGMTMKGWLAAQALRVALAAKRRIKQSPRLWAAARRLTALRRSGRFAARG